MILAAKELMHKGHEVVIGCRANSIIQSRAQEAGLPVAKLNIYTDFSLVGLLQLKKIVKKHQVDLIIACQNKDVRVAGVMSKLTNGPVILSRQGVQLLSKSIKYKWSFLPFCDGIITNTVTIKSEYDSYGWWGNDFVKVIHNGMPAINDKAVPFDWQLLIPSITSQSKIILSTGRLAAQKGFQYLIDAAKDLTESDEDIHFVIAGKGKLEHTLKKQIASLQLEERVHLIGFHSNIASLLKAADIFVLPSLYEGMPNSLMEALANGVPAVSTNVNGVSELMIDGEHGYIIPSADVDALKISIKKLLEADNREQMGKNASLHVANKFSVAKMVTELEGHLASHLSKP